MPVTYYDNGSGTTAAVTANEGVIARLDIADPASFTFNVPDGLWAGCSFYVVAGSLINPGVASDKDQYGFVTTNRITTFGSASGSVCGTGKALSYNNYNTGVLTVGNQLSAVLDAVTPNPGVNFNDQYTDAAGDYEFLTYAQSGGTGTLTLSLTPMPSNTSGGNFNLSNTALLNVSAVLYLTSIFPLAPAVKITGTNTAAVDAYGSDVVPFTGTATAVTGRLGGIGIVNKAFQPLYNWQVLDSNYNPPDVLTGQGTDTIGWTYNYADGNIPTGGPGAFVGEGNADNISVSCTVTNGRYPHQVAASLLGSGQAYVYYGFRKQTRLTAMASWSLAEDAHRRPVALSATADNRSSAVDSVILGECSQNAGRTYLSSIVAAAPGTTYLYTGTDNPSLLIDRRSNHYRAIYSLTGDKAAQIYTVSGILDDHFTVLKSSAAISGITGYYPVAAQHPTDQDYVLLVYSDAPAGALKCASSLDVGATWKPLSTILPSVDLQKTGRPALCWSGSTAIVVYSTGSALRAVTSADRGKTWAPVAAPVSTYLAIDGFGYYCLSLAEHGGQVYLLAFAGDTQHSQQYHSPRLFVSGNSGQTWKLRAAETAGAASAPREFSAAPSGILPAMEPPSGIGGSPFSGLLRLDASYTSQDCGLHWLIAATNFPAV